MIHAAALDPNGWQDVLAAVVRDTGGRGGMLQGPTLPGRADPFEYYALHNLDETLIAEGIGHYTRDDPFTPGLVNDVGWDFSRVAWCYRGCDPDDYDRTPFWNDYWLKLDAGDMLSLVIDTPDDAPAQVLSVIRPAGREGFKDGDVARLQALAPHLRFAAALRRRTARGALPTSLDRALLDIAPVACILLDIEGRILFANSRAGVVAGAAGSGLRMSRGRLEIGDPAQNAPLQAAIRQASQRRAGVARMGRHLSLRTSLGPVTATVAPLGEDNPLLGDLSAVRAAVYLETAAVQCATTQAKTRLRALFALSEAEAQIALALLDGRTPTEIAKERGRSRRTVEHQTAAILRRTGSRRLTDLHALRPLLQG
jgi:PAS domain-containing protein/DNA-binding CsgD family transcriptional regulator